MLAATYVTVVHEGRQSFAEYVVSFLLRGGHLERRSIAVSSASNELEATWSVGLCSYVYWHCEMEFRMSPRRWTMTCL